VANRLLRQLDAPPEALLERLPLSMAAGFDWPGGLLARLGADTFVMIVRMDGSDRMLSRQVAATWPLFLQPFIYRGQEIFLTASLGTVCSDTTSLSAETLLQRVDMALRDAKLQGRNQARPYHHGLDAQVAAHLSTQSDLRRALQREEFEVF